MFRDKTVLITGASSGIGAALARRFCRDGAKLMLVARRADRLAALADELRMGGFNAQVGVVVADLTEDGACERVVSDATLASGSIDVLINNAGVGEYGRFAEKDLPATESMMRLNMTSLVRLTHRVLPDMLEHRSGWIMNVASTAAFQPTPYMGAYGATKSFVLSFSLSLREEVRRKGVVVTCVCPGPVMTGFFDRGGYEARRDFTRLAADVDAVAEKSYRALAKRKAVYIPGCLNAFGAMLPRLVSMKLATRLVGKVLGPRG
ncbi:MAG: SDR family oxidoreductase [Planctomycetota bacterium]